jgi:PAS domain S-box-containing protein
VCTSANPAAAKMLGYDVSELMGQCVHDLIHHSHPDGSRYAIHDCRMQVAVDARRADRVEQEVFWRRDGSRLPVEYLVSPLVEGGQPRGFVLTFVDTTERWQSSEALERAAARLRQGIREGELVLNFQPKIQLITGRVHTVEALVRWRRDGTLTFPDDFIPLAEQTGVIGELTEWVVRAAAEQAATWLDDGLHIRIAVNLSGLSLSDTRIPELLVRATDACGISASLLAVELTETALAVDPESAVSVLAELAALGVDRAIDDFGTGYSSLSYLKHLPVTELKIDKSFVMNMSMDARDQAIVAATVHMARSLGLRTTAEGVENALVLQMLRYAECDAGQGYHWSRPVPATELTSWLSNHSNLLRQGSRSIAG